MNVCVDKITERERDGWKGEGGREGEGERVSRKTPQPHSAAHGTATCVTDLSGLLLPLPTFSYSLLLFHSKVMKQEGKNNRGGERAEISCSLG